MKKYTKKYLLLALIIFGVMMLIFQHAHSQGVIPPQPTPTPAVSLRVLAGQNGRYVGYAGPSTSPTYPDLQTVVNLSTDVVTGTVLSNKTNLSPDETFITTDYQVRIDSVLKGGLTTGSVMTVRLPGGLVAFNSTHRSPGPIIVPPDDPSRLPSGITYAEIRTPWFKKMRNGGQYYLFLTSLPYGLIPNVDTAAVPTPSPAYATVGGPQGVFEIVNGVVKSNSGRLHDPMWQYHNMPVSNFGATIQLSIANEPHLPPVNPPINP